MQIPPNSAIKVGEPNWAPLELVRSGLRAGELHVHGPSWGDRVVQALAQRAAISTSSVDGQQVLPLFSTEKYVEVTRAALALDHVHNRDQSGPRNNSPWQRANQQEHFLLGHVGKNPEVGTTTGR